MTTRTSLLHGDALTRMAALPDRSIGMILTDLPYGCTANHWDSIIPLAPMWEQFGRLCSGAVVLHSQQPFSSQLVTSNLRDFRYSLVWAKNNATGHLDAKRKPLRKHEDILVFWANRPPYNPQMTFGHLPYKVTRKAGSRVSDNWGKRTEGGTVSVSDGARYPTSVLAYPSERGLHATQKPVALAEHLICTYTNPGSTILDCCMGSGSTGIAAMRTGRSFVGIERDPEIYLLAWERMRCEAIANTTLALA